jgi:hypothetical protein
MQQSCLRAHKEYIAGTPKSAYSKLPETAKRKVAVKRK